MWKKRIAVSLVVGALLVPVLCGRYEIAQGSVRSPSAAEGSQAGTAPHKQKAQLEKAPSLLTKLKNRWSRFRPVQKPEDESWDEAEKALAQPNLLDKVYDEDMSQRMHAQYAGVVAPHERLMNDPVRWPTLRERERYEQSRKDLANWTMKEIGKDQLKDFIRTQRENSAAIDAIAPASEPRVQKAKVAPQRAGEKAPVKKLSEKDRLAQAHAYQPPKPEEVPTRLRAKVNVLKARGALTFMNPVAIAMVEGGAGSGENMAVELNRSFQEIELYSKVRYGVDDSVLSLNVNKRLTPEVSVDLYSERWTGSKRGAVGEKSKDVAQMMYSLSF